jgi:hypothetical protein
MIRFESFALWLGYGNMSDSLRLYIFDLTSIITPECENIHQQYPFKLFRFFDSQATIRSGDSYACHKACGIH